MPESVSAVLELYRACNCGDAAALRAVLAADVDYYALGPADDSEPMHDAETLIEQIVAAAGRGARWSIERILPGDGACAVEYAMRLADGAQLRHGSEWITLDATGRVSSIRSYHQELSELEGFEHAEFGGTPRIADGVGDPTRLTTISDYYDACTAADAEWLTTFFTADIVHYFLTPNVGSAPVRGREHLARYWRKVAGMINARWVVESIIARGDEAVIEWAMYWNPGGTGDRIVTRGMEWYVFDGRSIAEIRSYHKQRPHTVQLDGFDYAAAGYSTPGDECSALHTPHPDRAGGDR